MALSRETLNDRWRRKLAARSPIKTDFPVGCLLILRARGESLESSTISPPFSLFPIHFYSDELLVVVSERYSCRKQVDR